YATVTGVQTCALPIFQDGQFLQAFMDVILDLDKLGATASASDLAGAKAVIATLKTHVDTATQLSTAAGLPTQMHALMVDFQTLKIGRASSREGHKRKE